MITIPLIFMLLVGCTALQSGYKTIDPTNITSETILSPTNNLSNQTNITIIPEKPIVIQPRNNSLNLYFLNVYGKATIVQKGQESILINGGEEADSSQILKTMRDLGIEKLSYIILTNPAPDTIGSLPYIILKAEPSQIYESGLSDNSPTYKMVYEIFGNTTIVQHNTLINFDDVYSKIIVPYDDGDGFSQKLEDNSLITKLIYDNIKILIMGSCGFQCEERIYDEDLSSDIVELSNDCSATSLLFLQKVNPKVIIARDICPEVEDRIKNLNIPIYKTKEGSLSISIKNQNFEVIR